MSATRYAMVVDTKLCVACKACVLACKAENNLADGFSRDWLVEEVRGTYPKLRAENRSERCNHCTNAPCVTVCPTGASHIAEGGIVLVTADKCTGCKACMAACPYDARYVTPDGYVDKCTFCLHRVQRGEEPACVAVCPTKTLHFGEYEELADLLSSRHHKVNHPESGAEPNVFFLD